MVQHKKIYSYNSYKQTLEQPTVYLKRITSDSEASWSWVQEDLIEPVVETAVAIDEEFQGPAEVS